jgi:hypothetical protein
MTAPSQKMDWVTLALSSMTAPDATVIDGDHNDDDDGSELLIGQACGTLTFPNMRLHNLCTAANAAVYKDQ